MGELEKKVRREIRNTSLQRAILKTIDSISTATTAAMTGSVYRMYRVLDQEEQRKKYKTILQARNRLVENGLLTRSGRFFELTRKGRDYLSQWERLEYKIPRPKRWDGKWRLLIFDIPERKRELRNKVRNTLCAIGFQRLQDSVWVYPHECEDFIALLKADFKIGKDVLYVIVEALENDRGLRDYFGVYPD